MVHPWKDHEWGGQSVAALAVRTNRMRRARIQGGGRHPRAEATMRSAFLAALLILSGSAAIAAPPPGDAARALASADWSKMETVAVTMTEYAFSPAVVPLKAGVPTKLVLRNEGREHHYFVAEAFFQTIASRKIQGSDGEVKAPSFTAVEVYAGKSLEWFLVPMEAGTFELLCTVKGHADHGMKGTIQVH